MKVERIEYGPIAVVGLETVVIAFMRDGRGISCRLGEE